jgi:transcription antitermination factor NusG
MLMRDLLEKLNQLQLTEAPVKPGERKGISFNLKRLDKVRAELDKYKNSMSYLQSASMPPELKGDMQSLQDKLDAEIEKVNTAYSTMYEKSRVNDRPVKMDNLFKALSKNCKEIIKVYKELNKNNFNKQRFLFRGIRSSDDALYGKPFEARKPKDSDRELHDLLNNAIKDMGFEADRENSTFTTGDRSQASGYGYSLYVLFPVDGFKFTWSKTVKDLVLDSAKRMNMIDKNVRQQIVNEIIKSYNENPEKFPFASPAELFRNGYDYNSDYRKVESLIEKNLVPETVADLLDELLTPQSIQEHFKFTDKDLFEAILSNKEIYLTGPYYAVNIDHVDELIKFLQQIDTDNVELPDSVGEMPLAYEQGDVVKVLNGPYKDMLGTITYEYTSSVELFISTKINGVGVEKTDIELYKLPDGSIPMFERGEKVIVTDSESRFYGVTAVINYVYPNGKIEATDEVTKNSFTMYKNQVAPYSEELEQKLAKELESKPPTIHDQDDVVVSDPDSKYYKARGRVNHIYSSGTIEVYLQKLGEYIDFQPEQLVLLKNAGPDLVSKEDKVFNVGDKVNITGGEHSGYVGKVDYLYGNGIKASVDLTGLDKKIDVKIDDLEHYDKPEKPAVKFKVGDTVKITDGDYKGNFATVSYVSDVFPDEVDLKLLKNGYLITLPVKVLELSTDEIEQETLKVGDKVKVISGDFKNQTGTVEYVYSNYPEVAVAFSDGSGTPDINVKDVEKIEPEKSSAAGNIKVGDIIKVNNPESGYNGIIGKVTEIGTNSSGKTWVQVMDNSGGFKTFLDWVVKVESQEQTFNKNDKVKLKNKSYDVDGSIATIIADPDSDGDYKVVTDDGKILFVSNFQMEKIADKPATEPAEFKIGDTVIVTREYSAYDGKTGTITDGPDSDGDYVVQFSKKSDWSYFNKNEMAKVENKAAEQPKADVTDLTTMTADEAVKYAKEGQKVQIMKGPSKGKTGEITHVYKTFGDVEVTFDDGKIDQDIEANAIKILPTDQDEIDNLTWEPEPEVQVPSAKLQVNDRVEVVSDFPSLIGMKGTVLQVNPLYDFVSVELDGNNAASSFPASALKKIDDSATSALTTDDFTIGDYVIVTNDNLTTYGKQGKVVDINPIVLFVDFPDTNLAAVKPNSVKKIDKPNLTVNDFSEYDAVKVIDNNYSTYNQTGYVTGTQGNNLVVSINDTPYTIAPNALEKIS